MPWTGDGTTIIFNSDRDGGDQFELYSVPVGGGEATNLTETTDASEQSPEVSPDGGRILNVREDNNLPGAHQELWVMDSDESQNNGGTGLYLVSTASDGAPHTPEELVAPTDSTAFYDPQFSRDGETIFVHDNNSPGLYAVDATTGEVTPLFEPASENDRSTYSVVPFSRAADGTFE